MSLARHIALMRNAPFLRVLSEEALRQLAFVSTPMNLKPRQTLFEAGEAADGAVLVLGGQLRLLAPGPTAPPRVVGVGHLVDDLALIVPVCHPATAVAQTSCELLRLQRSDMLRILSANPEAAARLHDFLARRTGALVEDVTRLSERLKKP